MIVFAKSALTPAQVPRRRVPDRALAAALTAALLLGLGAGGARAQQPSAWEHLPRMQLERQFAGPLQDTLIQRWRDPGDGTICYLYLPINVQHSEPGPTGFVQYGANTIGSITCTQESAPPAPAASAHIHTGTTTRSAAAPSGAARAGAATQSTSTPSPLDPHR
jgi:hypothetical protein